MRATHHSGRIKSSARHNDRNFDTAKADHIDISKLQDNVYVNCYDGMTFKSAENRYYTENFADMIADINARAEKARHPERKTNASKLLASKKTMPEEVIFQVGNKDVSVPVETLTAIFNDFNKWHEEKFGDYVKTLNMALHVDEKTPHIHVRRVWTYDDPKGFKAIGQHKALEQMGYELPDSTKPRGKNNNLKMVYSAECRQKWLEICAGHGVKDIEKIPAKVPLDKQNLPKNDFIIQKQSDELNHIMNELHTLSYDKEKLKQQVDDLTKGKIKLQSELTSLEDQRAEVKQAIQLLDDKWLEKNRNIADANGQLEELNKNIISAQKKYEDLNNNINFEQQRWDNLVILSNDLESRISDINDEVELQRAAAINKINKISAKVEEWAKKLEPIINQFDTLLQQQAKQIIEYSGIQKRSWEKDLEVDNNSQKISVKKKLADLKQIVKNGPDNNINKPKINIKKDDIGL